MITDETKETYNRKDKRNKPMGDSDISYQKVSIFMNKYTQENREVGKMDITENFFRELEFIK